MSKVSVIIAAYNVEKYIAETINSVVAQTLKDIEIVVVDDCSTDGTFDIISKCAELDDRIKVVRHEKNSSVNVSRITGLKNSSGEYVMYIDGDDKLTPNACEKAYKAIKSEKVDMLQFNFEVLFVPPVLPDENIERELRKGNSSPNHKVVSPSKAGVLDEKAIGGESISFTIWDKIYKRELLEKASAFVPNEYLNMAEDVLFSFLIQFHARSYSYIPDKIYLYRFGCGMSTTITLSTRLIGFIAKMSYIYSHLSGFVKNADAEKECEAALCKAHRKTYHGIAGTYFHRLQKDQRELFISEVMKYGDVGELVLGFSELLHDENVTLDAVASKCAQLDIFASRKTKAKTIGVFYFRVFNGGIENIISSLTDMWVKSGYNVVLFTDEKPNKNDYYINPSIKRIIVPTVKDDDFFDRKKRIKEFRKSIIENDIDVMVYNAWNGPTLLLDEMIIKSCGVNLLVHTHGIFCCETSNIDSYAAYYHSILPKLYSFADSVVALTDVDHAWWQTMGIRSFKTVNPIQFQMDAKTAELNGSNMLLVGRISIEKQVIDAIKIAELVRKEIPNAKLTVVGKGDVKEYVDRVNDYISKNKLDDLVDMVGFKSDTLPYYLTSDVLISTSRCEGFGLALMESKLCGIPLVSYELPNLDITRECKGMVVVEQSDIKGAADAIIKMFKDEDYKKQLGRDARESIEDFYRIDLAEHWKNIFEQTVIPKPKPKPFYKLTPSEIAARVAVDNYSEGMYKRLAIAYSGANSPKLALLEDELARFKRSESYRVGMIITFIPRKIKAFFKMLFRRKEK